MKLPPFRHFAQLTISVALIIYVLIHLFYGNLANAASSALVGLIIWACFSAYTIVSPPEPSDEAIHTALGIQNGPKTFGQRSRASKSPTSPDSREGELEGPDI